VTNLLGSNPGPGKTLGVAFVGVAALLGFLLMTIGNARSVEAQLSDAPLPSFEVASIRRHIADPSGRFFINLRCGQDPGRCTPTDVTAKNLIGLAYGVEDFQVFGGPSWIDSDKFDIEAKVDDSLTEQLEKLPQAERQAQLALMMRSLLADRFNLKIRHETKELAVFALVRAKGGSKLTEVPPPDFDNNTAPAQDRAAGAGLPSRPGAINFTTINGLETLTAKAVPITSLVFLLTGQTSRPVVDQTGLKGTYDFKLQFAPEAKLGSATFPLGGGQATSDSTVASLFTALQEQLGLRLESTKGMVQTLVIDHIEEPSPN
jgi:uncharacterized protein (TIGR03435 family)